MCEVDPQDVSFKGRSEQLLMRIKIIGRAGYEAPDKDSWNIKIKNFDYIAETDSFVDEANMERDNNRR